MLTVLRWNCEGKHGVEEGQDSKSVSSERRNYRRQPRVALNLALHLLDTLLEVLKVEILGRSVSHDHILPIFSRRLRPLGEELFHDLDTRLDDFFAECIFSLF